MPADGTISCEKFPGSPQRVRTDDRLGLIPPFRAPHGVIPIDNLSSMQRAYMIFDEPDEILEVKSTARCADFERGSLNIAGVRAPHGVTGICYLSRIGDARIVSTNSPALL